MTKPPYAGDKMITTRGSPRAPGGVAISTRIVIENVIFPGVVQPIELSKSHVRVLP